MREALGLFLAAITTAPPPPPITKLRAITLHAGINRVPGFLIDGGTATIVESWRGNGNAHGFHVWTVLAGPFEGKAVGLVTLEDGDVPRLTITDEPFDGERVLGSVRFATARIGSRRVSLLIRATLDSTDRPLADHDTATVRWFRLDHEDDAVGRTTDVFVQIGVRRSMGRYCNAELAMRDLAGVPLPREFAGANAVDGCFANDD